MNLLINIGHPAHVHYYRNLAFELTRRGHQIKWTVRNIQTAINLLDFYGFSYSVLSPKSDNLFGKVLALFRHDFEVFSFIKREKIDMAIGFSIPAAHSSLVSNMISITFDDDDDNVQPLITKLLYPFTDCLLSPMVLKKSSSRRRRETIFYAGIHEYAYLHPKRFTPDATVLDDLGIDQHQKYFILRFNKFKAHHDIGVRGITLAQKVLLVDLLKSYGKVFITTEGEIENELKEHELFVAPEKIHSLIYFSYLFLGDSQTMSTEAALLGTPALKCNSLAGKLSVPNELEQKYGLGFSYLPSQFELMYAKTRELLCKSDLKSIWRKKLVQLQSDYIDVTGFWVWFVENYPKSKNLLKRSPEYQYQFK